LDNGQTTEELFHVKYDDRDEEDMGGREDDSSCSRCACGTCVILHKKMHTSSLEAWALAGAEAPLLGIGKERELLDSSSHWGI
jgi:hypothetical protein